MCWLVFCVVVRALVPRMTLDDLFEQKGEVAKAVLEELEKVTRFLDVFRIFRVLKYFGFSGLCIGLS